MSAPQFPEAVKRAQAAMQARQMEAQLAAQQAQVSVQRAQEDAARALEDARLQQSQASLQDLTALAEARHNDESTAANLEAKRKEAEFKQRQKQQAKLGGKSPTQATVEAALKGTESNGRNLNQTSPDFAGGGAVGALMESLGAGGPQPGGPGGAGVAASTGQPSVSVGGQTYSAPAQITSSQRTQGTEWRGPAGPFQEFIGLPQDTTTTTTQDNAMRPVDVANIQLQQQAQQLQTFMQLRDEGAEAGPAMAFAQAAASGDAFAMAAASKGLGKGITLRTKEAALSNLMLDTQTKQEYLNEFRRQVQLEGAAASVDPRILMGVVPGNYGGDGVSFTAGGKPKMGGGSGGGQGGMDIGEMVTAATAAIGKGTLDEPNSLALQFIQNGFLQGSGGRVMAMVPPKGGSFFGGGTPLENGLHLYNTSDLVAQVRAAVGGDPGAVKALLGSGMFIQSGNAIVPNPGSPNAANAIALANYVQGAAQLQAANPGWVDPLAGNSGLDISAALEKSKQDAAAAAAASAAGGPSSVAESFKRPGKRTKPFDTPVARWLKQLKPGLQWPPDRSR